jgi:hypothetical protein
LESGGRALQACKVRVTVWPKKEISFFGKLEVRQLKE